ncbi:15913_t:CDS:1, partial [Acaulospora morrowiae]
LANNTPAIQEGISNKVHILKDAYVKATGLQLVVYSDQFFSKNVSIKNLPTSRFDYLFDADDDIKIMIQLLFEYST